MRPRLSLLFALMLLAACSEPAPSTVQRSDAATPATAAAPEPGDAPAPEVSPDADGDAPAAPAPASASTPAPAAPSQASTSRPPMVEVNAGASVYHATSGAETLTLRGGPSTSAENLGTFSSATVLECQDLPRDDAWCRIRAEMPEQNREPIGWAKRRHLTYIHNSWTEADGVRLFGSEDYSNTGNAPGPAEGFPVTARWDILADDGYANVRATPSADGDIVRRLDNRVMTDVVRCGAGEPGRRWCEISSPVSGWVHQSGFHRQLRSY